MLVDRNINNQRYIHIKFTQIWLVRNISYGLHHFGNYLVYPINDRLCRNADASCATIFYFFSKTGFWKTYKIPFL